MSVVIETRCRCCEKPMRFELDSELNFRCDEPGCRPISFVPDVNLQELEEPSIIESF